MTTIASGLSARELAAWRGFLRAHAQLTKELDAELTAERSLPLSHYDVLTVLDGAPGARLRMRDLADSVVLSRSGLTRLVDRLVRDGLVEREDCESDARGAYAVLLPAGRERLLDARPVHQAGIRKRFLRRLSPEEQDLMAACWEKLMALD
jgi:DNA-binding MarR family transcriptional regulator